jgi:hypothetical protein
MTEKRWRGYGQFLSTLKSAVKSKTMRSVRERGHQLLRRVGLEVRLMEVSGGMVGVRAREQESLEC